MVSYRSEPCLMPVQHLNGRFGRLLPKSVKRKAIRTVEGSTQQTTDGSSTTHTTQRLTGVDAVLHSVVAGSLDHLPSYRFDTPGGNVYLSQGLMRAQPSLGPTRNVRFRIPLRLSVCHCASAVVRAVMSCLVSGIWAAIMRHSSQ
jgi:hypothetical protein